MINAMPVLAVVPARSGSKGLPDKNIRPLHKRPLLGWPIQAALGCVEIDRTICSTDSENYRQIAIQQGAEVPFIRPPQLANDTAASVPVVLHAWDEVYGPDTDGYLVLLEPTSPLTEASDISQALQQLISHADTADAIVGISDTGSSHPAFCCKLDDKQRLQPFHDYVSEGAPRRQDVEPVYYFDGSLYISKVSVLREQQTFYHARTMGFPIAEWKSHEIDTIVDFYIIETLLNNLSEVKQLAERQS